MIIIPNICQIAMVFHGKKYHQMTCMQTFLIIAWEFQGKCPRLNLGFVFFGLSVTSCTQACKEHAQSLLKAHTCTWHGCAVVDLSL